MQRRRARSLLLALGLSAATAATAPAAIERVPLSEIRQSLFSSCFASDGSAWLVGELGRVYVTRDNAQTFERVHLDTRAAFLSIACLADGTIILMGQHGNAKRSRDGGRSWQDLETGTNRHLLSVAFADNDVGVAVGDFGTIVRTEDGGTTWTRVALPEEIPLPEDIAEIIQPGDVLLYDLTFISREKGWMVGEFGVIFTTEDGGQTWTPQDSPVETTLFGVSFADELRGWAVGIDEILLHTTDGGLSWQRQRIPIREGFVLALYDIAVRGNIGWAVGDSGYILRSDDGGRTWAQVELPIELATNWFRSVSLTGDARGIIAGSDGLIMVTQGDQYRRIEELS